MSGDYYRPNGGIQSRGLKRSHNDRGDARYLPLENPSRQFYHSNNWIPPGNNHGKRMGSIDYYYDKPNKVLRMGNSRSLSTSSVPSSSSPSTSYSQPPHIKAPHSHEFMQKTVMQGSRRVSSSSLSSTYHSHASYTRSPHSHAVMERNDMNVPKTVSTSSSSPSSSEVGTAPIKVTLDNGVKSVTVGEKSRDTNNHKQSNAGSDEKPVKSKDGLDSGKRKGKESSPALKEMVDKAKTGLESEAGPSNGKKNKIDSAKSQEMSRRIWSYFVANKQTKIEESVKEEMRMMLQECIKEVYPHALLILGGSSMNGFGSKGCDADMCLYLSDSQISQKEARHILLTLRSYLQYRCAIVKNMKVIFAKVPILKFQHKRFRDLDCDLNINHHTGVRNTALMQTYSRLDWRVSPLVMLIKQWAKNHGINDASQGTLSSYSYVLMIINYLQVGCKPPVVTSVQEQEWARVAFSDNQSILYSWNRLYDRPTNYMTDPVNQSQNSQDLYSLLKGFFAYYDNFDFENTVISIRLGSCFPTHLLPPNHQGWRQKYIFIEEPFDRINTARSVFDWIRYRQILDAFEETHQLLCKTSELNLETFLNYR